MNALLPKVMQIYRLKFKFQITVIQFRQFYDVVDQCLQTLCTLMDLICKMLG